MAGVVTVVFSRHRCNDVWSASDQLNHDVFETLAASLLLDRREGSNAHLLFTTLCCERRERGYKHHTRTPPHCTAALH